MSATAKPNATVLEVKKSAGQISVKLGRKKSLTERVTSTLKGE
jgi:hypothetical protein